MMVGIVSGTYSSIFIASPVLTAWKEREPGFARRRERIAELDGTVPAFADDVALAKLSDDSETEAEIEEELAAVAVAEPPAARRRRPRRRTAEPVPASQPTRPTAERRERNARRRERRKQRRKHGRNR